MRENYKEKVLVLIEEMNDWLRRTGMKLIYISRGTDHEYNKMVALVEIEEEKGSWYGSYEISDCFRNNKEAYMLLNSKLVKDLVYSLVG